MNSKEIGKTTAAILFATVEVINPKSSIAQANVQKALDSATLKQVTDCILKGEVGNTIKEVRDLDGQREITIIFDGKAIVAGLTESYPNSRDWKISPRRTIPVQPYMVIGEEVKGSEFANVYVEGNPMPIVNEGIDPNDPAQRKLMDEYLRKVSGKKIDGIVDDAFYPEDKEEVVEIIGKYGEENPISGLKQIERFERKKLKYQAAYVKLMTFIARACGLNRQTSIADKIR